MGIFPHVDSVERPAGAMLMDISDEWQAYGERSATMDRRWLIQEAMRKLNAPEDRLRLTAPLHLEPICQMQHSPQPAGRARL